MREQDAELGGRGIHAAIGITSGTCFAGLIGGAQRMEYTVHGPAVNLAARLMMAAESGALVDDATRDACLRTAHGGLEFEAQAAISVKGKEEPVSVWVPVRVHRYRLHRSSTSVMGARERESSAKTKESSSASSRVQMGALPPQRMLGREQDCELLRNVFARVRADWNQPDVPMLGHSPLCCLIEGEAGIGKSELCREALHYAASLGMTSFWTAGHPHSQQTPLRPFGVVVQGLFQLASRWTARLDQSSSLLPSVSVSGCRLSEESMRRWHQEVLDTVFADASRSLARQASMLLRGLLGLGGQHGHGAGSTVDITTLVQLVEYWICEVACTARPVLLVIDDAQHLDASSWQLCRALLASEACVKGGLVLVLALRTASPPSSAETAAAAAAVTPATPRTAVAHIALARDVDGAGAEQEAARALARATSFMRRARGVHARVTHLRLQPLTKSSLCEIVAVRWHTLVHGADDDELDASFWDACVHIGNLGERWVHDDGAALAELLSSSALGVHVLGVTVRAREGTQASWALVSLESAQEARSVLAPAAEQAAPQLAGLRRRAVSMVRGPFARTHMCTSSNAPPTPHAGNVLHVCMRGLALDRS